MKKKFKENNMWVILICLLLAINGIAFTYADISSEENGISITISPLATEETPYRPGDELTITVNYTNKTGTKLQGWNIVPEISPEIGTITGGNLSTKLGDLASDKQMTPIVYTLHIDEEISQKTTADLTFSVMKGTQDSSKVWHFTEELASVTEQITIKPQNGVELSGSRDLDSDPIRGELHGEFDLQNYAESEADYTYELTVLSNGSVIPESDYTVSWDTPMPGSETDSDPACVMSALETASASVSVTIADPEHYSSPYQMVLTVTDTASGESTTRKITVVRAELWDIIPAIFLNNGGLNLFYYGNVANDPDCPFSDASSLESCLLNLPINKAKELWDKYKYDLYDPNCFYAKDDVGSTLTKDLKNIVYDFGDYGTFSAKDNKYSNDYPRFEDDLLAYPKDLSNSPFHNVIDSRVNSLKYSLEDNGINYSNYFKNLEKSAGPNLGDDNTERKYVVELSAETNPVPIIPKLYVFQIQTSWQMFDLLHANATETNTGISTNPVNLAVGSCSNNTRMANLYDIKKALIRFASYLKKYDDGSTMIAITNVQHATSTSMISGNLFSNDMTDIINGLYGWDTFGDCEHVHYDHTMLDQAVTNIDTIKALWTDADGKPVINSTSVSNAEKTCILIGGATENTNQENGYGIKLNTTSVANKDNTRNSNLDHVYGIRINEGVNVNGLKNSDGNDIVSWLDINENQTLFKQSGNGYYIAPSEDDVYDALIDIFKKNNDSRTAVESASVQNVKISDTITKDFKVDDVKAYYRITESDGTVTDQELDAKSYSVTATVNTDGTTKVEVLFDEIIGKKNAVVKIFTTAKEDFIGSNNVYTNVNDTDSDGNEIAPVIESYEHQKEEETLTYTNPIYFEEKPQVNVPIAFQVSDGQSVTVTSGETVDLKDLSVIGSKTMTSDVEELLNKGYQINGTVTYQWVDQEGNEVGTPSSSSVKDGKIADEIAIPSFKHETSDEEIGQTIPYTLRVIFSPEEVESKNVNDVPVSEKVDTGVVEIKVKAETGDLSIKKIDSSSGNPIENVSFEIYSSLSVDADDSRITLEGEDGTIYYRAGNGSTGPGGTLEFSNLIRKGENKSFLLKETETVSGYLLKDQMISVIQDREGNLSINGSDEDVTVEYNTVVIRNHKIYELPESGGKGIYGFLFFGSMLMTLSVLSGRKRKNI